MRLRLKVNINLSLNKCLQCTDTYISNLIMPYNTDPGRRPGCAPSVLITFINMMLFKSTVMPQGCSEYMFEGQDILQMVLLFTALLCIPVMLFGKPLFVLFSKRLKRPGKFYVSNSLSCFLPR